MEETSRRNVLKGMGAVSATLSGSLAGCTALANYAVNGRICPEDTKDSFEIDYSQGVEIDGVELYSSENGSDLVYIENGEKQVVEDLEPGQKVNISEELGFEVKPGDEQIELILEEEKYYCIVDRR